MYDFIRICTKTNEFVRYNLYTICIQFVQYELCCTNSYYVYNLYDKKNEIKTLAGFPNPCTNNNQTEQLPASSTAHRTAVVFFLICPYGKDAKILATVYFE